ESCQDSEGYSSDESDDGFQESLLFDLYCDVNCFLGCKRPLDYKLGLIFFPYLERFVASADIQVKNEDRSEYAEECTIYFPKLLEALAKDNFDETKFINILRIISISSILCIAYSTRYPDLVKHMLYILSRFRERSPMIDKLIKGDSQMWRFVLKHILPYQDKVTNLVLTADILCDDEF
ncbi:MAG: hypothetical protein Q4D57_07085, partial [Clostridia bacterium]|nr:hypothetical protein [Clostridia bacterium]